jgi:hypothetical protein
MYGGPAGGSRSDGTYSGIRRITTTVNDNLLTSVQLQYGLEGDESLKERYLAGARYGLVGGAPTEVSRFMLNSMEVQVRFIVLGTC